MKIGDFAQIGGLSRAARYDGLAVTQAARTRFRASFLEGHGCKVCPRIDLPADLTEGERQRRAETLHRLHYARISKAAADRRRMSKSTAARQAA